MKHYSDLARINAEKIHKNHIISRNLVTFLAIFCDVFALTCITYLSFQLYSGLILKDVFDVNFFLRHVGLLSLAFIGLNLYKQNYKFNFLFQKHYYKKDIFTAWNVTFIAFVAIIFLLKVSNEFSRGTVILSYFLAFPILSLARFSFSKALHSFSQKGIISPERKLIVGVSNEVERLSALIHQQIGFNHVIEEAILPPIFEAESKQAYHERLQGFMKAFAEKVRNQAYETVYLALPLDDEPLINLAIKELEVVPTNVQLVPNGFLQNYSTMRVTSIGEQLVFTLSKRPLGPTEILAKRLFDIIVGGLLMIMTAPILFFISYLIRKESSGPALFTQMRNGFNQTPFKIYKFRSMTVMEAGSDAVAAKREDARITKIGAFLRRWNLDELPQLINVVKGDMSLVGPRPHPLNLDASSEDTVALYAKRFNIKPGMTGWAQVNGLRGSILKDEDMQKRVNFDLYYMDNWSIWFDIKIMLRTVLTKKAFENAF